MAQPRRVVHYVNQFFGGMGGEEMAHVGISVASAPVGASRALQQALGEHGTVVSTLIGGDNYVSEQRSAALAAIMAHLQQLQPEVVMAGPAFNAGRYGLACAEVCKVAQGLGVPAVTAMHPENPGTLSYPADVLIVPTSATSVEMPTALAAMVRLALKLSRGAELGPAHVEGYLPRGIRRLYDRQRPGYLRALDMLQAKLRGEPFRTEVPIHAPETVAPAAPLADLSRATIAMVTTGGLVRKGNPDKQVSANATRYYRHTVAELRSLSGTDWEAYHAGYFNHIVNANPNYILPLNFLRDVEDEGSIGGVFESIYALPGVSTPVAISKRMGASIAEDLKAGGVDGCLLLAT
ncbi:MAG: glycine/betaine/sarcosine/D-proline family reductase selenoprotein B [Candidatus Tectomicrobia bacterium]|uniref:Glycine/betaine/sarcosine/D-proline family reductase selenoprotein B n=1 Tax=Tectimicrobiota bacterium TaxID=2528274 RepID=A0A938B2Z4_UNCTE|nr:glycine/betaine/sarcosine/D-proline family reductase selenoprotein B [Candidatus Tectomicrobia bacterium]